MKKILVIILSFVSSFSFGQTVQQRLGLSPNDGSSGYVYTDTVYTLPHAPLLYFNAYGNFASLRDTARSLFSVAKTPLSYNATTGVFDFDTTIFHSYAFYQTVFGSGGGGGGSTAPAGSTTQIQLNNSGSFGADTSFRYSRTGTQSTTNNYSSFYIAPTVTAVNVGDTLVSLRLNDNFNTNGKGFVVKQDIQIGKIFIATDANYNFVLGRGDGAFPTGGQSNFFGRLAGFQATNADRSNFFGGSAGQSATNANQSNFFGVGAGANATNASYSNFFGSSAGSNATGASYSNFLGYYAGSGGASANYSNFIGFFAGNGATSASKSNFIGNNAGYQATSASTSNFIGFNAGYQATSATSSIFIGTSTGDSSKYSDHSIFIGNISGASSSRVSAPYVLTGSNNIIIGSNITVPTAAASNTLDIGNIIYGFNLQPAISPLSGVAQTSGQISVGTSTPTSTLTTLSFSSAIAPVTTDYSATSTDHTINCTGGGTFTVTLPTAASIAGREYVVTNSGTGTITIATTSSQTFGNVAATPTSLSIVSYGAYTIQATTSGNWIVISKL